MKSLEWDRAGWGCSEGLGLDITIGEVGDTS